MIPPVITCEYCHGPVIEREIAILTAIGVYHKDCAMLEGSHTKEHKQTKVNPLSANDVLDIREELKEALP